MEFPTERSKIVISDVNPEPDEALAKSPGGSRTWLEQTFEQYLMVCIVVFGATLPCFFLRPVIGARSIALLYLLGVVIMALFVGRGPTLLLATLSALFWDFFFVEPITKFRIASSEDMIMLGAYFVVALVLGQLTNRIREQEKLERHRERRSRALYAITRELAQTGTLQQMLEKAVEQTARAFEVPVAVLLPDADGGLSYHVHPASTYDISGPEQPVADWAFDSGQPAGKFTSNHAQTQTLFMPLKARKRTLGVIGLSCEKLTALDGEQLELLKAFCRHIALALDRQRLAVESEKAKLVAESERLSKALLSSVSHEFRTPLAAIKTATGTLLEIKTPVLSEQQEEMVAEIQQATERLNSLVGKVLDVTRLESGNLKPRLELCDVNDLVQIALKESKRELAQHKVTVELAPDLPLVRGDFVLLEQALANLLCNAAFHTPPGTPIQIGARVKDGVLVLTVADRGPGIPTASIPRVFDKFYRGPGAPTGGTGLGLSLVKGFVNAHQGEVKAENRAGGGALFTIRLPMIQTAPDCVEVSL